MNKEETRKDQGIEQGLDTPPLHDTRQISTTLALKYYLYLEITIFFPISSPGKILRYFFFGERWQYIQVSSTAKTNNDKAFIVIPISCFAVSPDLKSSHSSGKAGKHSPAHGMNCAMW